MVQKQLLGVGTALVTPFTSEKDIDYLALTAIVEHQIANGVDYLVALGTTSEYITLSEHERTNVVRLIIEVNNGRKPIILGIGGNCTEEVVHALRHTPLNGISAILSVVPYYNKPSQEGIYQHYAKIAENSPLPIILYNVPGRTGVNMSAETTLRLQKNYSKIVAIKEASGNLNQIDYILKDKREDFVVLSGEDNLTLAMCAMGCGGVISVSSNAFPKIMSAMTHAALEGDFHTARRHQKSLLEVTDLLFVEGNPVGVKSAMAHKKLLHNAVRLPLVESSEILNKKIIESIRKNNL